MYTSLDWDAGILKVWTGFSGWSWEWNQNPMISRMARELSALKGSYLYNIKLYTLCRKMNKEEQHLTVLSQPSANIVGDLPQHLLNHETLWSLWPILLSLRINECYWNCHCHGWNESPISSQLPNLRKFFIMISKEGLHKLFTGFPKSFCHCFISPR